MAGEISIKSCLLAKAAEYSKKERRERVGGRTEKVVAAFEGRGGWGGRE